MIQVTVPAYDINGPVEVAPRIWWVGHYMEGDSFQCHCYLIENGRDSILFDPGSRLTFSKTFEKIERVIPFSYIKYFVVHHQDPDITGALDIIDELNSREDARILSHWRAIALLKHLNLKMPFLCVEEMKWALTVGERELQFVFTPYLHFPGAFCSFDKESGSLFSSDLVGGFTDGSSLFARDESYLESAKLFHEHYMPSREILAAGIEKFQKLPLKRILPQHGSIVTGYLIPFILDHLKNLDCGLYLMTQTSTDIKKLSMLNRFMNDFMSTLVFHRHFDTTAVQLLKHIQNIIPAISLRFMIEKGCDSWLLLEELTRFQGTAYTPEDKFLNVYRKISAENSPIMFLQEENQKTLVLLPLKNSESDSVFGMALIDLPVGTVVDDETRSILLQIANPLCVAVEREIMQQSLDRDKQVFYEMSIRDSLTGLYNRTYMNETIPRYFSHHDRGVLKGIALLMLDLDHFKSVNDTFGHQTGDLVLKETSRIILDHLRIGDLAVRIGGEEFAVFLIVENPDDVRDIAERIRQSMKSLDFSGKLGTQKQTVSGGLAIRKMGETLEDLLKRADTSLYSAKKNGRDRIVEFSD